MKIIDFHAHIFPNRVAGPALDQLTEHSGEYRPRTDGTLKGLLSSMNAANIYLSVVSNIATKPAQVGPIYDFCCHIKSDRIYPLISLHPDNSLDQAEDLLIKAEHEGIRGVKFHPMYQDFAIDDEKMFSLYELIRKRGFFVIFHTGFDIAFPGNTQADIERLKDIADRFRDLTIVATHTGGWRQWERVGLLTSCMNVYTEISMTQSEIDDDLFIQVLSHFDENKVFFGTDSPWTDQKEMVQKIVDLKIPERFKEKILFRNAESFLKECVVS